MRKDVRILIGLLFALIAMTLVFVGCKEETLSVEQSLTEEDEMIVNYLVLSGYDCKDIQIGKDGYTIEGDMFFDRETLRAMVTNTTGDNGETYNDGEVQDRQRAIPVATMVWASKVNNIKYFVHPSVNNCNNPTTWLSAIATATQNWNNISYCRVNFVQVTQQNQADLIISSDHTDNMQWGLPASLTNLTVQYGSGTMGKGRFPNTYLGKVGQHVSINRSTTASNRLTCIMHELGHTLGFCHSNGTNPATDGEYLHGTPQPDGLTSIMHGDAANNVSTTFNTGDVRAARLLYPDYLLTPSSFNAVANGPGKLKITIATPAVTFPSYWIKCERCNSAGTLLQIHWVLSNATTLYVTSIPTGTYKFRVSAANYRQDVISDPTAFKTVTIQGG